MPSEPLIAVFTKNRTNPAYAGARLGADRTAQRLGARTCHFVPEAPDDIDQQIALVAQALQARPDAFVFTPVHESAVDGAIGSIDAAGIPLVNFINRMHRGNRIAFVGSDDRALAIAVAQRLFVHLNGTGNVVVMQGTPGSITSRTRLEGFLEAAGRHPGIVIVAQCAGDYQQETAQQVTQELLARGVRIDGLLCANDVMALGAIDAMTAAGRMIPVVGVNALPEAITAIKRGMLLATVDFDATKMGRVATEAAIRHLRGERVPAQILLPVQVVDASNCAPWERPLGERECPLWEDVVASV
ncbi:MAG: substrate-binding domain-containing protein [Betaproteobacteria bacterium]|nr:substrate-binding domain-containing protein [Betaproteobacteria bacterium]